MKTIITFPYAVAGDPAAIQAIITAAALTNFTLSGFKLAGNVITITANRLLTAAEKITVATTFAAAFPQIVDGV